MPVRHTKISAGHVLLNSIDVKIDDLASLFLVRAEVALSGVGAKIDESATLLRNLWLVLSNRVDVRAN